MAPSLPRLDDPKECLHKRVTDPATRTGASVAVLCNICRLIAIKASNSTIKAPINFFQYSTTHGGPFPETKS
jgi:hypothetical protein